MRCAGFEGQVEANRLRLVVIARDVLLNLPGEIRQRREDAAGEQVAFDLPPEFHLIEPRRVGRREMQMDPGMRVQKHLHPLGLVRREIVDDHVEISATLRRQHVTQEVDERFAGVPRGGLADDLAGLRVQRGVQRECAVQVRSHGARRGLG